MASPPIPPSLEHLATRPFSFYPPIVNVEHNEWLFRKATWSEILVVNCKSGAEVWISRRFVGEVSRIDDPVLIVGLNRELEYKGGGGLAPPAASHRDAGKRLARFPRTSAAGPERWRSRTHSRNPVGIQRQKDLQADWRRVGGRHFCIHRGRESESGRRVAAAHRSLQHQGAISNTLT